MEIIISISVRRSPPNWPVVNIMTVLDTVVLRDWCEHDSLHVPDNIRKLDIPPFLSDWLVTITYHSQTCRIRAGISEPAKLSIQLLELLKPAFLGYRWAIFLHILIFKQTFEWSINIQPNCVHTGTTLPWRVRRIEKIHHREQFSMFTISTQAMHN